MEINELVLDYFFFKLPIYKPIKITEDNRDYFMTLLNLGRGDRHDSLEGYNPFRDVDTTFSGWGNINEHIDHFLKYGGVGGISIKCRRYGDVMNFYVRYDADESTLTKIGQYPSIADFHSYEVKRYGKVLSKEKIDEFSRAIGLVAHGIGIGSFVYLRRIFEHLILEAFEKAKANSSISEADFHRVRMEEKIELLQSYLPTFLVEHKGMYSILSLGIHELDEKTCLAHFDTLRVGIEIILDEKLDELLKKEKIDSARKSLLKLKSEIHK